MAGELRIALISAVVGAILGLGGTVAARIIVPAFTEKSPDLVYRFEASPAILTNDTLQQIVLLNLGNRGDAQVNDITGAITYTRARVLQSSTASAEGLTLEESLVGGSYRVHIDDLNPTETVDVTLLVAHPAGGEVVSPRISVRADGIVGRLQEAERDAADVWALVAIATLTTSLVAYGASYTAGALTRRRVTIEVQAQHAASEAEGKAELSLEQRMTEKRHLLVEILQTAGLPTLAAEVAHAPAVPRYREVAERLKKYSAASSPATRDQATRALRGLLLIHPMVDESRDYIRDSLRALGAADEQELRHLYNLAVSARREGTQKQTIRRYLSRVAKGS